MTTAISVTDLKKSYKNVTVLKGVDLTVKTGTVFALLGANGSGKTTIINILTTLIKADGGTALVNGVDVAIHPDNVRSYISLTGQFAAVDEMLTARENLRLIGDLRHVSDPAATAERLLVQFKLTEAAERRTATFSGGMRRRLDVAMSLIGEPAIIFLDEPTTGLDPESRSALWHTIRTLAKNGTTIFLTTQYLEEADQLADKIAVLHHGTIAASGTAHELKKLLPSGLIELLFHTKKDLVLAIKVLPKATIRIDENALAMTITTDGSVAALTDMFATLRDNGIEPAGFSQKTPTLDDVFMKIIDDKKENA